MQVYCPRHVAITEEKLMEAKEKHPDALFAVHPECTQDVLTHADYIGSTAGIIDYVVNTNHDEFIIGTVDRIMYLLHRVKSRHQAKVIYSKRSANLRQYEKSDVGGFDVLTNDTNEVFVAPDLAQEAMKPLRRMLELGQ